MSLRFPYPSDCPLKTDPKSPRVGAGACARVLKCLVEDGHKIKLTLDSVMPRKDWVQFACSGGGKEYTFVLEAINKDIVDVLAMRTAGGSEYFVQHDGGSVRQELIALGANGLPWGCLNVMLIKFHEDLSAKRESDKAQESADIEADGFCPKCAKSGRQLKLGSCLCTGDVETAPWEESKPSEPSPPKILQAGLIPMWVAMIHVGTPDQRAIGTMFDKGYSKGGKHFPKILGAGSNFYDQAMAQKAMDDFVEYYNDLGDDVKQGVIRVFKTNAPDPTGLERLPTPSKAPVKPKGSKKK